MNAQIKERILDFKSRQPDFFKKNFSALEVDKYFKTLEDAKEEAVDCTRKYIGDLKEGRTNDEKVAVFETLDGEYLVVHADRWGEAETTCEVILNFDTLMRLADGESIDGYY